MALTIYHVLGARSTRAVWLYHELAALYNDTPDRKLPKLKTVLTIYCIGDAAPVDGSRRQSVVCKVSERLP